MRRPVQQPIKSTPDARGNETDARSFSAKPTTNKDISSKLKLAVIVFGLVICIVVLFWRIHDSTRFNFMHIDTATHDNHHPVVALGKESHDIRKQSDARSYLHYWNAGNPVSSLLGETGSLAEHKEEPRYVLFEDDTGGWNNIRISFEVFVVVARLTGRTLVMPPPCRFYLLDRGPITLFDKAKMKQSYSTYDQYFDLDDMKQGLDIITTEEFLDREAVRIGLPADLAASARGVSAKSNGGHTDYFLWLRQSKDVAIWPTGPGSDEQFKVTGLDSSHIQADKMIIHFPMHMHLNYRYLGGVRSLLKNAHPSEEDASKFSAEVKTYLRDAVHYNERIIKAASFIISKLGGPTEYNALHIRRNELQYKEVFLSAESSLENIKVLLTGTDGQQQQQQEHFRDLYIATDETDPVFFEVYAKQGIKVHRLADFNDMPEYVALFEDDPDIRHKYEGMVEQLVCASSHTFIGTPMSTFTSYMHRLRHYLHAPNTACLYHTENYADKKVYEQRNDREKCSMGFDVKAGFDLLE